MSRKQPSKRSKSAPKLSPKEAQSLFSAALKESRAPTKKLTPAEQRTAQMEATLRRIEEAASAAIHKYGITQQRPERWVDYTNLVLEICAPIRDQARDAVRQ
jgi:hypothetical protein